MAGGDGDGQACCIKAMTPIMWSHGVADRVVSFEAGQAGPPFLQSAGMSCEFKAYPDLGHSIAREELAALEGWIKARLKASQDKGKLNVLQSGPLPLPYRLMQP